MNVLFMRFSHKLTHLYYLSGEPTNCVLGKNVTHLRFDNCTSIDNVEVTSCTGQCDSKSL